MDWHLTWQDPVALGLVALSLLLARWVSKRFGATGCAACKVHELPRPRGASGVPAPPSGTVIPVERLRLGKAKG